MSSSENNFEQLATSLEEIREFQAWYLEQKAIEHYLDQGHPVGEEYELDGKYYFCFDIDRTNFQRWCEHGRPQDKVQVDWLCVD